MHKVPIAITGMHRSGTSMITRALHDSGLHLIGTGAEELIDAAEDNPEGFWENKAIVACNDELLEATGGAWDNPPELPPLAVDDPRVAHIADASTAAIAALSEHDHWGFKDPRACLTAAYWLDLEPDLRFIICVRHPLEVALSLKRRNQNSYSLGLALWERYYATVLEQVPADRRIVTHYDTYFTDPEGELARLCRFAQLEPAPPRVRSDLRHHTIGVDLGDAGASASLRGLYAELCRAAGVTPPREAPADEGRVRRLILDGAVAQRHADQRQAAIDRLEERERQFRAEHAATEARLRSERAEADARHRATEARLRSEQAEAEARHRATVRELEAKLVGPIETMRATVARIDERTSATAKALEVVRGEVAPGPVRRRARRAGRGVRRFVLRPGKRAVLRSRDRAVPAARTAMRQLPAPAQDQLRRARALLQRAAGKARPTAPAATGRRTLPEPARGAVGTGRSAYRRAVRAPVPAARAAVQRLPEPMQRVARRGWRALVRAQRARADRSLVAGDAATPLPTPKGPPLRQWKAGYEQMVATAWPGESPWLVVSPGSPREVRDARAPRATPFPDTPELQPFADDLSHIAHLEAQRYRGHQHLVVPEGSRPWFRQQTELRDHVVRSYGAVVDAHGSGAVYDLTRGASPGTQTLRSAVETLAVGSLHPSVLDWTDLELAAELPELATFRPPAGVGLPYLDGSVDVVVLEPGRDVAEARRVAALGVVSVRGGPTGTQVEAVEALGSRPTVPAPRVVVWASAVPDDPHWVDALAERADGVGAALHVAPLSAAGLADVPDHDVLVAVEAHVLPLPGTIETATVLALAHPDQAAAGKVLRADGHLESAGATVFFDRSVGLIASGSADVRAPWHEFARPVCFAAGLLAAPASLIGAVPPPESVTGHAFLREWCAAAWAHGASVVYQPLITAVRVAGDGGEPSTPLASSAWQRVLDLRPPRPDQLGDGAWRYLLAHDDVEACRG